VVSAGIFLLIRDSGRLQCARCPDYSAGDCSVRSVFLPRSDFLCGALVCTSRRDGTGEEQR
jgi:hypothetical protein